LKEGAADFMVKPWHNEKLLETITDILKKEKSSGASTFQINNNFNTELVGQSEIMNDIFYKIEKIAPTDANVLLLGENGTGKDLIAKATHQKSQRAGMPYIKVDMGSLSESLFESELFGHRKGAFTGALENRTGRFEAADKGTLFLDEIGNISLTQQTKLLSALQNRQITPIGSNDSVSIDIRLICATNVPIEKLTNEERFRKDLLYRIHTVAITVPPLRNRKEDIPLLAKHFIRIYAQKYLKSDIDLSPAAMDKLLQHPFPGNVRELQYTIERAVIMANTGMLQPDDIIFSSLEEGNKSDTKHTETNLNTVEKHTILHVIEKYHGNISKAAKELGITRTALYRRLNKYEI
jgi:DNA-binding NtrC family response regulator